MEYKPLTETSYIYKQIDVEKLIGSVRIEDSCNRDCPNCNCFCETRLRDGMKLVIKKVIGGEITKIAENRKYHIIG